MIGCVAAAAAFLLIGGQIMQVYAQRDPFAKAPYMRTKNPTSTGTTAGKSGKSVTTVPVNYGPPPIESRIDYYKRQRELAAANGSQIPKVTSVLLLSEMNVTGIFKTPRGWAAMVEASPIKLSYTIYPGEKFFDGQLVAVEENKLVFRKVTKTGPGKFVASVENKPLQQFTMKAQIEGTAPQNATEKTVQTASTSSPTPTGPVVPTQIVSPLDEMNKQPAEEKGKSKKNNTKKPGRSSKG
jgi:hypothetical protein